jgi:hypothetical protein
MVFLKLATAFAGILLSAQTVPAFYHSNQFDQFVKQETQRSRTKWSADQISGVILSNAGQFSVPVRREDIHVSTNNGVIRVEVDYSIPIHLVVYSPAMRFRSISGAFLAD